MRTIMKVFLLILFLFDSMLYNCIYTQKNTSYGEEMDQSPKNTTNYRLKA